jgi:class 3 adenylate cyclase
MEPRIQYAKTSDGVNIAFCVAGEGTPPLVQMPTIPMSHLEVEWQNPAYRRWYEGLARTRQIVRYDGRGMGLSDRDPPDFSVETHVLDLEAVVDRLALERFALLGTLHGGPVAVEYAARHPNRVSHLLLWCTYARGSDYSGLPEVQTLRQLIGVNWETYTEAAADVILGRPRGDEGRWFAAYMRDSVGPEVARAILGATNEVDVSALLPEVKMPTLVLHRRQFRLGGIGLARELASTIPDARLAVLEGASVVFYMDDTERAVTAIEEFLGGGEEVTREAEPPKTSAFRTILFTDIEGSTAMTQRLGDAKAREVMREHERITRECLRAHGGSEVKTMGDGFMASFGSAVKALECAVALQKALDDWNRGVGAGFKPAPTEALHVRIGLNAGEPIAEDDPDGRGDLFGTAVIRAARIAALAQGGEILVANVVRELAEGKGFLFGDRGDVALRGFDDPVRLFEVRWREDA